MDDRSANPECEGALRVVIGAVGRVLGKAARFVGATTVVLPLGGCASYWPQREGMVRPEGIYVIHVAGIMGPIGHDRQWARGLLRSGVSDVRVFEWTSAWMPSNLMDSALHEKRAKELADRLRDFHTESPESRIVISAHSGGALVALRAVEMLGADERIVEQLWLIAPAVRPEYDLVPALDRVERLVSINSRRDWLILGMGTRLLGTADRAFVESAGMVGFTCKDPRLEQWPYEPGWRRFGNRGDHIEGLNEKFVLNVVGPAMVDWIPIEADVAVSAKGGPIVGGGGAGESGMGEGAAGDAR